MTQQAESALVQIGHYERELGANLERLLENALDWEHLPWLHASSFSGIELIESLESGFRARLGDGSVIELLLDRQAAHWVTRTLEGRVVGHEIRTQASQRGPDRSHVSVAFWVPDTLSSAHASGLGRAYEKLYATLYDEDEAMMVERQHALDERRTALDPAQAPQAIELGPAAAAPRSFWLGGREWRLRRVRCASGDEEFIAHAVRCPHWLGPLSDSEIEDGEIVCPWHGYRFDVRSGEATAPVSARCRLPTAPRIEQDAAGVLHALLS